MNLFEIRNLFFLFLKQFNDEDIHVLMNFLEFILHNYKKDSSKFIEIINTNITSNLSANIFDNLYNFECQNENEDMSMDNCNKSCCNYDRNEQNNPLVPLPLAYNDYSFNRPYIPSIQPNEPIKTESNNDFHFEDYTGDDPIDIPSQNESSKTSRYAPYIVNYLIDQYNRNKYPTAKQIEEIAAVTDLKDKQVTAWFAERRVKFNHTKPNRFSSHSDYLVARYNMNKYPTSDEIKQMALVTQLTEKQVYTWFQERRVKLKHTQPTRFSQRIINFLIEKYNQNIYPSSAEIKQMSQLTKLTEKQVYTWFQERRVKLHHTKKLTTRK